MSFLQLGPDAHAGPRLSGVRALPFAASAEMVR